MDNTGCWCPLCFQENAWLLAEIARAEEVLHKSWTAIQMGLQSGIGKLLLFPSYLNPEANWYLRVFYSIGFCAGDEGEVWTKFQTSYGSGYFFCLPFVVFLLLIPCLLVLL